MTSVGMRCYGSVRARTHSHARTHVRTYVRAHTHIHIQKREWYIRVYDVRSEDEIEAVFLPTWESNTFFFHILTYEERERDIYTHTLSLSLSLSLCCSVGQISSDLRVITPLRLSKAFEYGRVDFSKKLAEGALYNAPTNLKMIRPDARLAS